MLKFFRQIRQQLLTQGHIKSYTTYAIGEIVLVVLGILIALQINNWNEQRKDRTTETQIYKNLLNTLQQDSIEVEFITEAVQQGMAGMKFFIEHPFHEVVKIKSKEEIKQLLSSSQRVGRSFFPRYGVYQQIVNDGKFSILQSEEIKNQLLELYDRKYKLYAHVDEVVEQKNQFLVKEVVDGKLNVFPPMMELEPYEKFNLQGLEKNYEELVFQYKKTYQIVSSSNHLLKIIAKDQQKLMSLIRKQLR